MRLHTLDTIRLADFISLFLGDHGKAVAEGEATQQEIEDAARRMCEEYIRIVGGRQVAAQLSRENEALKLRMRDVCLRAARALCEAGDTESARAVLRSAGMPVDEQGADGMIRRIDGLMAADAYRRDKAALARKQERHTEVTREYFVRERVAVMRWAKMYIDERQISASEYAWMVRAMCDDLQRAMMEQQRKKNKR